MPKIKVSDLAKELKTTSKELLKVLADLGISAKTAASSIEETSAKIVKDLLKPKRKKIAPPKVEKPARPPGGKEKIKVEAPKEKVEIAAPKEEKKLKEIIIPGDEIVVKDLAEGIGLKPSDLIKELMKKGILATINQRVDVSIAKMVASSFNVEVKVVKPPGYKEKELKAPSKPALLVPRPPIVTVMGHVDHGKTKLLDAIRKTNVIDTEAGGITQHIGAYQVEISQKFVTFLDTPGHEAFTELRARGAKVTDIAVLVVAADDGVMPQTIEAIHHAKAAGVPIIVAINKIDKPEANLDRVKKQLMELSLTPEEWGGNTVMVPISAKLMKGIDNLLEMILLVAEMQELKADPSLNASGVVIEAKLDKGRGPVATVLVRNGTLKIGDILSIGSTYGKVRALINDKGLRTDMATPSTPVEVLGLTDVPQPGDLLSVVPNIEDAKLLAEQRKEIQEKVFKGKLLSLEDFSKYVKEGARKDLNLIIKADVQGSLEALASSLENLILSGIHVHIIHGGVGNITESDIMLAAASQAIVIGFGVNFDGAAKALSEKEGVDARLYNIIYNVVDDVKLAMEGMLEPEYEEVMVGRAEVKAIFKYSKIGTIAGSLVTEGKLVRGSKICVLRDGNKIYEGKLTSLKRFKEDVKEVEKGFECGVAVTGYEDFKEGDTIESFETKIKPKKKL